MARRSGGKFKRERPSREHVSAHEYGAFFETGSVTGKPGDASTPEERFAFVKAHWKDVEFRKLAWPWCAAFVDASNVARWERPEVHETTKDAAQVKWLVACEEGLRKLGYVPIMVSDGNLRHLVDEPWTFQERYSKYPHATATGQKADFVLLRAMRDLPEAIGVSRDRFMNERERALYGDVLADRERFYAYRFDEAGVHFFRGDDPLRHAARRLAARVGAVPTRAP